MTSIEAPKPQYAQIAALLRSRIDDGTYPAGSVLPSEPALADELRISRVTVNRAVAMLRSEGLVKVRRGAGTFVRSLPKIPRDAQRRYAARDKGTGAGQVEVTELNLRSRTDYGNIRRMQVPRPDIAKTLQIETTDDVLLRPRVLYANDEPTQIADSYLPWSIAGRSEALMHGDAGQGGSYSRLADLGYGPVRFTEDVNVRMPTDAEQRTLELEASQPVFEIWHVAFAADDTVVEVCIHVMPGHLWTLRYGWDDPIAAHGAAK
ncbi:GntR family transcriptional regulator [Dactylosporangium cerinum]|uniref:GntR family transcriptional regulator n=1 Tax=Dactylosporangium cerinum TaxID=1434730 RepID=A0ABV9WJ50_9ACTN